VKCRVKGAKADSESSSSELENQTAFYELFSDRVFQCGLESWFATAAAAREAAGKPNISHTADSQSRPFGHVRDPNHLQHRLFAEWRIIRITCDQFFGGVV